MTSWAGRLDGRPVTVTVTPGALVTDDTVIAHTDVDELHVEGPTLRLVLGDGREVRLSHLARRFDELVAALVPARAAARRAALLQWTGDAPLDDYEGRRDGQPVVLTLFRDGCTVEPWAGVPELAPFGCLVDVAREGWHLTLVTRGLPSVPAGLFGNRTDELLADLDRARQEHRQRTAEAYARLDAALGAFGAPDGWALDRAGAGAAWEPLRRALMGQPRGCALERFEELAGERLRLGLKLGARGAPMPLALVPVGSRVAVEVFAAAARATYVFAVDDVDRLNALLLVTSFRREAFSLPADRLGRWALAVRTLPVVRWGREAFVARVVHDERWERNLGVALGAAGA